MYYLIKLNEIMTINIKNFLNDKTKLSKMGEFQNLKQIEV